MNKRSARRRRALETLGMLMVGDGVVTALAPTAHIRLWRGGPRRWRRTLDRLARRPATARWMGVGEAGLGLWLASRQLHR